jgi:hypothetical protein
MSQVNTLYAEHKKAVEVSKAMREMRSNPPFSDSYSKYTFDRAEQIAEADEREVEKKYKSEYLKAKNVPGRVPTVVSVGVGRLQRWRETPGGAKEREKTVEGVMSCLQRAKEQIAKELDEREAERRAIWTRMTGR